MKSTLKIATRYPPNPQEVRQRCRKDNYESQSNGSLMRITPLAVYLHKLDSMKQFVEIVSSEVTMTHFHEVIRESGVCYCLAIKHLINHPGEREAAYGVAKYCFY